MRPMTVLLAAAALAVALYLAAVATLFVAQRRFVFVPGGPAATAAEAGLAPDFRDVVLDTADGERLAAWWKPPAPGRAVVLYLHGNGGSLWNRRFRAEALGREGRGVLLLTYRGYPGSTVRPPRAVSASTRTPPGDGSAPTNPAGSRSTANRSAAASP